MIITALLEKERNHTLHLLLNKKNKRGLNVPLFICSLTLTSATHPGEDAAPGGGRSGVGGGAPTRYIMAARGFISISPWIESTWTYSISQLNLGGNFIGNLQVVSSLNTFNLGRLMYYYLGRNCTANYYPKVYIGTTQTTSLQWNYDNTFTSNSWPKNYQQGPQKGEANTGKTNILNKDLFCVILY